MIAVFHDRMLPILDLMENTNSVFITSHNHVGSALGKVVASYDDIVYRSPKKGGTPKKGGSRALKEMENKRRDELLLLLQMDLGGLDIK